MENGLINQNEAINTQVIYATSAGQKSSYAYAALIDVLEQSIISPKTSFCMGLDYRIPVLHGLIDKKYVQNLKLSPSYDEKTFAAEYWITRYSLNYYELLELLQSLMTTTKG